MRQPFEDDQTGMQPRPDKTWRLWAAAVLLLQLLSVVWDLTAFYQIHYQLDSPLIPKDIVREISAPYNLCACWMAGTIAISLLLLFLKKHKILVISGGTAILIQCGYLAAV